MDNLVWVLIPVFLAALIVSATYFYVNRLLSDAAKKVNDYNIMVEESKQYIYNKQKDAEREYENKSAELDRVFQKRAEELNLNFYNKSIELEQKLNVQKTQNLEDLAKQLQDITDKANLYKNNQEKAVENALKEFSEKRTKDFIYKLDEDLSRIKNEYKNLMQEISASAELTTKEINDRIEVLKSQELAAIQARIRQYEEINKEDFYTINLSPADVDEIADLRTILYRFRNPLPLRKAIYDVYYKNPINDMISRVTQGRRITGIYKITNIENGMCYIGQSVDIGARWLQHCKRGAGIDEKTQLKIYAAMEEFGLENFKFEIIEEVAEENLSKQEKYWSEFFGAKVFGYSIRN